MRNLMKFGIVLVVLAMVASTAFAGNDYEGPNPGSWCVAENWDNGEVPECGDGETTKIAGDDIVIIDCAEASCDKLEMRGQGSLQVGTQMIFLPEPPWFLPAVRANLEICKELDMSDDKTSDYTTLNIVNGTVTVGKQSKDVFEDGSGEITIAAGSSLTFEDGMYFGDSNGDGCGDTYTLDIAGNFACDDDRLEHRGGHLIINLTGNGSFSVEKTTRLSSKRDAIATIDISDNASASFDKVELGEGNDGANCDYSLAIKLSGNGTWDGGGEDIKDQDEGQIFKLDVTDNGSFTCDELDINDDDSEIHITMDSGLIDIENDIDMNAGTIVITGGELNVDDDLKLGDDGVATMTVSGTADVWIDDLYMGDDSALTINGVRMDIDDLKEMKSGSSIEINGDGELVIKNTDLDDIDDLIADGLIVTSDPGKVIISDDGVTHDGRVTVQAVYPFEVDIKPGGCPNPLRVNFRGRGVFTVAIVGSEDFDVTTVNVGTASLAGVSALRGRMGDVSTAGDVCDAGPDGIPDLVLKFNRADVLTALEGLYGDLSLLPNRAELSLIVLAETDEGTVGGIDTLVVLNRGAVKRRR